MARFVDRHYDLPNAGCPRAGFAGYVLQYPFRGVGRYASHLLRYLLGSGEVTPLLIGGEWTARPGIDSILTPFQASQRGTGARLGIVKAPYPLRNLAGRVPAKGFEIAQRVYWEQIGLQVVARRLRLDVLYSPYHALPAFPPRRTIVTIHDLIPLTEPGYAGSTLNNLYFRLECVAAKYAAAVIADSEFSKAEIARLLHIAHDRIRVVPLGVEPWFNVQHDAVALDRVRARLRLPERFLLYVGGSDLRKNIGVLLQAVALVRDGRLGDVRLPTLVVVANAADAGSTPWHPDWRAQARKLGLEHEVLWIDRVAEEDLPAVYRGCTAFCFPSRSEGFGLTPLEALACGTPVLCSNSSSLPEVVGDAGLLLPPDDPVAWARAIVRVASDAGLALRLKHAGPERAAAFTWERTGRAVLDVILDVAGRRNRS